MTDRERTYQRYLINSVELLEEDFSSANMAASHQEGDDRAFSQGQAFGIMQALSLPQQQAVTFGIPLTDIHRADYNPEAELGIAKAE